ncbi:MAG: GxxExxY protein [Prevotellaceae bacterium]|jgi:GxxExxY protein|nr:GxxExxY protein [Prevotellaceae bacterium]
MTELLYKEESYAIIGACMKVHATLGSGFLEAVYQEALSKECRKQAIPFKEQEKLKIYYEGATLNKFYKADFVCYDKIIVEIKSTAVLLPIHRNQLLNYLSATGFALGLIMNFGTISLTFKRIIHSCNSLKSV